MRPTNTGFLGPMPMAMLRSKKILISNISASIKYIIPTECGYQVLVTKTCPGGRVSDILTNFIPNISTH